MTLAYCYDFEFLEDGATIEVISVGIVCEDGREYYAVNSDMAEERISKDKWLCENVIPHLPLRNGKVEQHDLGGHFYWNLDTTSTHVKPKWVIANEVREFLLGGDGQPELWAYYAAYDHVALAQLWGKMISLPTGIPMFTHELMQEWEMSGVEKPPAPEDEHNALADARWGMQLLKSLRV